MKSSGWIATAAAAVVILGGGIFAVQALTADPGGEAHTIDDYAPSDVAETPAASAEHVETVEPVETPEADPAESSETVDPSPEYTEAEAELIQVTRYGLLSDLDLSDAEILEAAQAVCDERDAGLSGENLTTTVRGATDAQNVQFRIDAVGSVCVAQD